MVQRSCSCKKCALLTPQRPLLHPSPGFHRHRTSHNLTHACTARVLQPHADSARIHAKKTFFTLSRSIEKRSSPPCVHSPAAPWWYTRQHTITRRAVLVVACRALAQDQPRRFHWFAVLRGWVRLGGIGGKVQASFASLQHEIWVRSKETWVVGSALGGKRWTLHLWRTTACCAGAPGGWKCLAALPCPAQLAMAGGCCVVTGEAG